MDIFFLYQDLISVKESTIIHFCVYYVSNTVHTYTHKWKKKALIKNKLCVARRIILDFVKYASSHSSLNEIRLLQQQ